MTTSRDDGLVGQIGRLFDRGTIAGLPEGQILERYAAHRDGAAFEALVARHGSTVLGVCRRFLRDPNDVEDAFQATFVILARKAGGLRDREALGPWLHGVAYRVASRARADAARRRRLESPDERALALAAAPEPGRQDLRWLLDEEILRLPDKLRLPVVLCLMEGRTYDEAAHQLRWTVGMVRGRLAEARIRLRDRLIRRGEAPSVALASIELEAPALPPGLVESASRITSGAISGEVAASSAVALANRTMGGWLMGRIATAALALIAAGVAVGIGSMGLRLLAREQGEAKVPVAQTRQPAQEKGIPRPDPAATPRRRRGPGDSEIHPITVEGRALDRDGRPVAGALIVVTDANRVRSADVVLGRGASGADGRFVLRDLPLPVLRPDPGPVPRPAEGRFEVAGSAPGLAFAWHAVQSYRPTSKPDDLRESKPGLVAFPGERIVSDLVFGPPARVRGRIVDDQGRPVVGAKIQFGYIDNTRNPDGHGIWNCGAINPDGGDDLPFNGIGSLPEGVRSTRTDADGRYAIDSLPREVKLLTLIDHDPGLEPYSLTIATSASGFSGVRSLGHDGVLDHTFILPRTVRLRVTLADSGRPAPGVTALAQGEKMRRAGAIGTTDPDGRATLALPPGPYTIRLEPPIGLPYRLAEESITVGVRPTEASVALALAPGAVAALEAVDADSGRGIAGAGFEFVTDTSADRREVRSRTAFVDHPLTDDSGKILAVMDPGRRQFFPRRSPLGYEPATKASPMLTLNPGETSSARFEFRKRAEPVAQAGRPEEDEAGRRLRSLWEAQARLIGRGRMRVSRTYQGGNSIPPDRLRQLLGSLDPGRVPPLLDLIRKTFPEAESDHNALIMNIVTDGINRRQDGVWEKGAAKSAPEVVVYNGRENVSYNPGNAQVDIGDDGRKSGVRMAVAGLDDFCHWPRRGGKVVERGDGRITMEWRSGNYLSRIVADEATGFVYRESSGPADGISGRDRWQFAPRRMAGGAIIPGLSVEHDYQKDSTSVVWIKAIESIDLDAPVPPETFLVSVPPGTQVRDYREGRDDTYRGVARRPITDVVAHADADPRRYKPFVPPIKVGQAAPPIDPLEWLDPAGKIPAPTLAGKVVLIDFWGIECGPCIAQLPEVREAAGHFTSKGLVIIGLHDSSGKPEQVAAFASKRDLTWPLAIDRPGEGFGATFEAYGVRTIPGAAVIDRRGRIAFLGRFPEALAKAASLLEGQ